MFKKYNQPQFWSADRVIGEDEILIDLDFEIEHVFTGSSFSKMKKKISGVLERCGANIVFGYREISAKRGIRIQKGRICLLVSRDDLGSISAEDVRELKDHSVLMLHREFSKVQRRRLFQMFFMVIKPFLFIAVGFAVAVATSLSPISAMFFSLAFIIKYHSSVTPPWLSPRSE